VQAPRIPIWIGGGYPIPGPTARALRWDGSMLYRAADGEDLEPEDIAWIRAAAPKPDYDISCPAPSSGDPVADAARLAALEAAGATWASVYVEAQEPESMRRIIDQGPARTP
jgi:hypothetical protein